MGRRWMALAAFAWLGGAAAYPQTPSATLLGTVADASGAVLPGVSVTVENVATGITTTVTTNSEGHFVLPNLPPGSYKLIAQLQGFATAEIPHLDLQVNQSREVSVRLRIGQLSETVT